jgi:hypothetical protein
MSNDISRTELIYKADEIYKFAQSIFNEKRVELLKKAADYYRAATLSLLAEKIEKESKDWEDGLNY